ncbi:MAG: NADH-quinone oxidoreductase subunit E, partial [Anaerolineaceae bacterium]|nr:NADH-quinone oxidoreductase subunit E [Anaerolineaceae bacterium]
KANIVKLDLKGRTHLLPALYAAQGMFGYIPEEAAVEIARFLKVPLADVFGVIDFYAMFYARPVSKTIIHVCADPACAMAGADGVLKRMTQSVVLDQVENRSGQASITVERAPCLGLCEHAPALQVQGPKVSTGSAQRMLEETIGYTGKHPHSVIGRSINLLTENCGKRRPTNLKEYEANHGYAALRSALSSSPEKVIEEIKAAGLVGRGGAAFPTGAKWESASKAPGDVKYIVCNADEAVPGTFKDRVMMEEDPHRILEGILIAAFAVGASKGYMYIRGEYFYPYEVMTRALADAKKAGYFGDNIFDSGFSFDLELRRGAGAYICGEETALFESIEGKRGFPRIKPPFPTTSGLFGKPTVINNVETLCNVPLILRMGAEKYRKIGTEKSPGPKLFCLSGDVVRPGLYEVPFGITFRELLFTLGKGLRPGRSFQTALFGGAAGAFATPKDLDVKLTFEDLRAAGLPLGSGVITVLDDTRDVRDILLRLANFFAEESCGKCYPCQIGTQRQLEIMQRIAAGESLPGDVERLQDTGWTMTDASLCGLGQTAASAVMSAMKIWPEQFTRTEAINQGVHHD